MNAILSDDNARNSRKVTENDMMLLAHDLIENARSRWPKKDRAELQAEVESLIDCAFDEWEHDNHG